MADPLDLQNTSKTNVPNGSASAANSTSDLDAMVTDVMQGVNNAKRAGTVAGGVVGGMLLLAAIIGLVFYCRNAGSKQAGLPLRQDHGNAVNNKGFVFGGGGSSTKYDPIYGRLEELEPSTQRYQGKLRVPPNFVPEHDCRMSLLLAGDSLGVPDIAGMVEDVATRLEEDGIPPSHPEYNSQFALYIYTYHANHLPSAEQFYALLNAGLRSRQEGWFKLWMPIIYYLTRSLGKLPDVVTTVYKGMKMPPNVDKYDGNKKIHWSGFSSTTTSEAVAQNFAGIGGLVLKIKVRNGKNVQPHSWFGTEEAELILSPNMEFIVSKKAYQYAGRTCIDLDQLPGETLYS